MSKGPPTMKGDYQAAPLLSPGEEEDGSSPQPALQSRLAFLSISTVVNSKGRFRRFLAYSAIGLLLCALLSVIFLISIMARSNSSRFIDYFYPSNSHSSYYRVGENQVFSSGSLVGICAPTSGKGTELCAGLGIEEQSEPISSAGFSSSSAFHGSKVVSSVIGQTEQKDIVVAFQTNTNLLGATVFYLEPSSDGSARLLAHSQIQLPNMVGNLSDVLAVVPTFSGSAVVVYSSSHLNASFINFVGLNINSSHYVFNFTNTISVFTGNATVSPSSFTAIANRTDNQTSVIVATYGVEGSDCKTVVVKFELIPVGEVNSFSPLPLPVHPGNCSLPSNCSLGADGYNCTTHWRRNQLKRCNHTNEMPTNSSSHASNCTIHYTKCKQHKKCLVVNHVCNHNKTMDHNMFPNNSSTNCTHHWNQTSFISCNSTSNNTCVNHWNGTVGFPICPPSNSSNQNNTNYPNQPNCTIPSNCTFGHYGFNCSSHWNASSLQFFNCTGGNNNYTHHNSSSPPASNCTVSYHNCTERYSGCLMVVYQCNYTNNNISYHNGTNGGNCKHYWNGTIHYLNCSGAYNHSQFALPPNHNNTNGTCTLPSNCTFTHEGYNCSTHWNATHFQNCTGGGHHNGTVSPGSNCTVYFHNHNCTGNSTDLCLLVVHYCNHTGNHTYNNGTHFPHHNCTSHWNGTTSFMNCTEFVTYRQDRDIIHEFYHTLQNGNGTTPENCTMVPSNCSSYNSGSNCTVSHYNCSSNNSSSPHHQPPPSSGYYAGQLVLVHVGDIYSNSTMNSSFPCSGGIASCFVPETSEFLLLQSQFISRMKVDLDNGEVKLKDVVTFQHNNHRSINNNNLGKVTSWVFDSDKCSTFFAVTSDPSSPASSPTFKMASFDSSTNDIQVSETTVFPHKISSASVSGSGAFLKSNRAIFTFSDENKSNKAVQLSWKEDQKENIWPLAGPEFQLSASGKVLSVPTESHTAFLIYQDESSTEQSWTRVNASESLFFAGIAGADGNEDWWVPATSQGTVTISQELLPGASYYADLSGQLNLGGSPGSPFAGVAVTENTLLISSSLVQQDVSEPPRH